MSRRETAGLIGTANVDWVLYYAASPAARLNLSRPTLDSLAQRLILSEQIGVALCEAAVLTGTVNNYSDHFSQPDAPGHRAWLDWQFTQSTFELHGHLRAAIEAHTTAVELHGRYPATVDPDPGSTLPDQPPRHPRTLAARCRRTRWWCDMT